MKNAQKIELAFDAIQPYESEGKRENAENGQFLCAKLLKKCAVFCKPIILTLRFAFATIKEKHKFGGTMTDVKWIKLPVDFFEQMSARMILNMEMGEKILLIWIKLLCLAGKANRAGAILSEGGRGIGSKILPMVLGEDEGVVCNAVVTLKRLGIIAEKRGVICLVGFDEEQSLEELNRQKELTRARVKRYRERKRREALATLFPDDEEGESNGDVTECNAGCNAPYINKKREEKNRKQYSRGKEKPRLCEGHFDATEVFEKVLARSYKDLDDDEDLDNGGEE